MTNRDDYGRRAEVRIERTFDALPEAVFEAWTDPAMMARWMWAGLGSDAWAEGDLRVGGAYRVYTKFPGGVHEGEGWSGMCGVYVTIDAPHRLVYTVHWDADVGYNRGGQLALDEVVDVSVARVDGGTQVVYRHLGIPDDGMSAPTHRAGIEMSFNLLAEILAAPAG